MMSYHFYLFVVMLFMTAQGNDSLSEETVAETREQNNIQNPILERTISPFDIPPKDASFKEKMFFFSQHKAEIVRDINASYLSRKHPLIDIGKPTGFKQLTNEELIREKVDLINPLDRYPLFTDMTVAMSKQRYYDDTLKRLYWRGISPLSDKWNFLDLDFLEHLEWEVELNKDSYQNGEPIGIRIFLKNASDQDVPLVYSRIFPGFILNSIELKQFWVNKTYRDVYLTRDGERLFHHLAYPSDFWGNAHVVLKPGQRLLVNHNTTLNLYYDLTLNGRYELTFYRRIYLDDNQIGEYPKPCTIRFRVGGSGYWPGYEVEWPESDADSITDHFE